jgi:hypothetical protein
VDTPEDYERAQRLFRALSPLPPEIRFSGKTIIAVYRELFCSVNDDSGNAAGPGEAR